MKNRALETLLLESCKGERGKSCGKKVVETKGTIMHTHKRITMVITSRFPSNNGRSWELCCRYCVPFFFFFFLVKVKSLDQKENKRLEKENCATESCVGECRCDREYYKLGVEKLKWHSNRSIKKIEDWKVIRFELARHVRFQEK